MRQRELTEEIAKLERQLQDEKFLLNAPATAIEKVRVKLAKLQDQYIPIFSNTIVDEGEWGFRWERLADDEIWVTYPNPDTGLNGCNEFMRGFVYATVDAADRAWTHVNRFIVHPDIWVQKIWQREQMKEEEVEKRLYLKLREKYDGIEKDTPHRMA